MYRAEIITLDRGPKESREWIRVTFGRILVGDWPAQRPEEIPDGVLERITEFAEEGR